MVIQYMFVCLNAACLYAVHYGLALSQCRCHMVHTTYNLLDETKSCRSFILSLTHQLSSHCSSAPYIRNRSAMGAAIAVGFGPLGLVGVPKTICAWKDQSLGTPKLSRTISLIRGW